MLAHMGREFLMQLLLLNAVLHHALSIRTLLLLLFVVAAAYTDCYCMLPPMLLQTIDRTSY